jgi:hypothetical protein
MVRVKSFKWSAKDKEAKVVYSIVRDDSEERHTLECSDPPKQELLDALQGLADDAVRECEVISLSVYVPDQIVVRSVAFSWTLDIMGASICLLVKLDHSDAPLVLNTPHKPSQAYSESGGHTLGASLVTKLEALHVLIERYIDGDRFREQVDMFEDQEEERQLSDADGSVSLNGGPSIGLGKFTEITKAVAKEFARGAA